MACSRQHRVTLDGGQVQGHAVPLAAYAELLAKWNAAMRDALPRIVESAALDATLRDFLRRAEPYTAPPEPGSSVMPWSVGVPSDDTLPFADETALDRLAGIFENGVVEAGAGSVPHWMTVTSARAVHDCYLSMHARGIEISLGDHPLGDAWSAGIRAFLESEENAPESELELLGHVVAVSYANDSMTIETVRRGRVRTTLPQALRRDACSAMADGAVVDVLIVAALTADGQIHHAKLRTLRTIPRQDYATAFEKLWGTAREIFSGTVRDENGVPDPDLEPEGSR